MTSAYPLQWPEGWPRTPHQKRRSSSPFMMTFDRARTHLLAQIRLMDGKSAVISSWLAVRNDGLPYADQARRKLEDPGVAVYFLLRGKQMVMARDLYWNVNDNLRSIGLAIEHLRGLERHGGAPMMERAFEGFMALEAPDARSCWATLGLKPGASKADIEAAYRELAKSHHPDSGGSHDDFVALNAARNIAMRQVENAA